MIHHFHSLDIFYISNLYITQCIPDCLTTEFEFSNQKFHRTIHASITSIYRNFYDSFTFTSAVAESFVKIFTLKTLGTICEIQTLHFFSLV